MASRSGDDLPNDAPDTNTNSSYPHLCVIVGHQGTYVYDPLSNEVYRLPAQVGDDGVLQWRTDEGITDGEQRFQAMLQAGHFRVQGLPFDTASLFKTTFSAKESSTLLLNVTEECNLRCGYCSFSGIYEGSRVHSHKKMGWETARRAIDYFVAQPLAPDVVIGFYGGEPLTNSDVMQRAVAHSIEVLGRGSIRPRFSITTNGVLLTKNWIEQALAQTDRWLITVSLDGPRGIHDRWRRTVGGGPTWSRIQSNLEEIQSAYPDFYRTCIRFGSTLTPPWSLNEIQRFFDTDPLVRSNRAMFTQVCQVGLRESGFFNILPDCAQQASAEELDVYNEYRRRLLCNEEQTKLAQSLFLETYEHVEAGIQRRCDELNLTGCCKPGAFKLFVDTAGAFHICERTDGSYPIGNLDTGIDRGRVEALVRDYASLCEELCRECWAPPPPPPRTILPGLFCGSLGWRTSIEGCVAVGVSGDQTKPDSRTV